MRIISPIELHATKLAELGLAGHAKTLNAVEAIAENLRRAASFLCPCAEVTLRRAVLRSFEGLVADTKELGDVVDTTIEAIVAHGDLLQHREIAEEAASSSSLLYAAPPSFIRRASGAAILLGVAPDNATPLPTDLVPRLRYERHVRRVAGAEDAPAGDLLTNAGFFELSAETWLRAPREETPLEHLKRIGDLLSAAPASGEIPGLSVIDPSTPVRYYPGRWAPPGQRTGRLVGRRRQAYGADLWCYVELEAGRPRRFLDLPLRGSRWRGCDEAWALQAAIDLERGTPQVFRLRAEPSAPHIVEFFSPAPMWARRRWDAMGSPTTALGCLFAYAFERDEHLEELRFLRDRVWLRDVDDKK